jgi:hypothetical protein
MPMLPFFPGLKKIIFYLFVSSNNKTTKPIGSFSALLNSHYVYVLTKNRYAQRKDLTSNDIHGGDGPLSGIAKVYGRVTIEKRKVFELTLNGPNN